MHSLAPSNDTSALALDDDFDLFAQCPPKPKFSRFGINQLGQLYEYGDTPAQPRRVLDTWLPFNGIYDIALPQRAGDKRKVYLDLCCGTLHPYYFTVLSLPCFNSPDRPSWPVRSLLGSLSEAHKVLDLRTITGKISARRGTKPNPQGYVANFIDLFIADDPLPLQAPAIDPDRHSLETTVERLRRALQLEHHDQ